MKKIFVFTAIMGVLICGSLLNAKIVTFQNQSNHDIWYQYTYKPAIRGAKKTSGAKGVLGINDKLSLDTAEVTDNVCCLYGNAAKPNQGPHYQCLSQTKTFTLADSLPDTIVLDENTFLVL